MRTANVEDPVDVPRSLAAMALVILPLAGCASPPAQADPALDTPVSVQAAQRSEPPAQPANEAADVPPPRVTGLDAEDDAALTVSGRNAVVVYAVAVEEDENDIGAGAARHAQKLVGIPYVWGGNSPKGFDCSGLIQYSYARAGMEFPRATVTQRKASRAVSRASLRPGDLVFFHIDGKRYSHIGIYIRSEEHTSELQSLRHLVCRLLLEKK